MANNNAEAEDPFAIANTNDLRGFYDEATEENVTMTLTKGQWQAVDHAVLACQNQEHTALDKCRTPNQVGAKIINNPIKPVHGVTFKITEEYEVALPFSDDHAMKWKESSYGKNWECPQFMLSHDKTWRDIEYEYSYKTQVYDPVRTAIRISVHLQNNHKCDDDMGERKEVKRPIFDSFDTTRRNYWADFNHCCKIFWLNNPELSREEAHKQAIAKAKRFLTKQSDVKRLLEKEKRDGKGTNSSDITDLEDARTGIKRSNKCTIEGKSIQFYEFRDESTAFQIIKEYLSRRGYKFPVVHPKPFMMIDYMLDHLKKRREHIQAERPADLPNWTLFSRQFDFIRCVELSAKSQSECDEHKNKARASTSRARLPTVGNKRGTGQSQDQQDQSQGGANTQNKKRKARKKKKAKKITSKQRKEFLLDLEAGRPSIKATSSDGSSDPEHDKPDENWANHHHLLHSDIRSLIDANCFFVDNTEVPHYTKEVDTFQNWLDEDGELLCKLVHQMDATDLKTLDHVTAHIESSLLLPSCPGPGPMHPSHPKLKR